MLEIGGRRDLLQKPLGAEDGGEFGPQNLYRHLAVVLEVLGKVNRRHATGTQFTFDLVPIGECLRKTLYRITHLASSVITRAFRCDLWLNLESAICNHQFPTFSLSSSSQFSTTMSSLVSPPILP